MAFIEARLEAGGAKGPRLQLVESQPDIQKLEHAPASSAPVTAPCRSWLLRRIRFLRESYPLDFLVDQETHQIPGGITALPYDQLNHLHRQMEAARDLVLEGISLEDAGMVRSLGGGY